MNSSRILILGAGCTGLGAAYRLHELGHHDFLVLERNSYPGGLATSFIDERGFTWDVGGHIQFSHYDYFDRLMEEALGASWLNHIRQSYIWIRERFIPYPFQNNIRQLAPADLALCLGGLISAQQNRESRPENFEQWITQSFGRGVADLFLLPYNAKVWAHPPAMMSFDWVGERVAAVDLSRITANVILGHDDPGWGPNSTFRFPLRGGTGAIWKAVASLIPRTHFRYCATVTNVNVDRRVVTTSDGEQFQYDILLNTLPLDVLSTAIGTRQLIEEACQLKHSGTHVVGIGIRGEVPEHLRGKNWLYFPEADCPFYRVTVFSNYSPNNVPGDGYWSLMAEVSESPFRAVASTDVVGDVLQGMRNTNLLDSSDQIASTWHYYAPHGYPTPTIDRDQHVNTLLYELERSDILSRGRFGAWRYEVANQDHSCMQGVEAADKALYGAPELTCWHPSLVNSGKHRDQRVRKEGFHQIGVNGLGGTTRNLIETAGMAK